MAGLNRTVKFHHYDNPESHGYRGWFEPSHENWIIYVTTDGCFQFFRRDHSGQVLEKTEEKWVPQGLPPDSIPEAGHRPGI